jgi:glycosyltransferase involved in cell wall biosynthesis
MKTSTLRAVLRSAKAMLRGDHLASHNEGPEVRQEEESRPRSLMFIASSDFDSLVRKGVAGMIAERDEDGYFDEVLSVHPLAKMTRKVDIGNNHVLYEFGYDWVPTGRRWRAIRYLLAPAYFTLVAVRVNHLIRTRDVSIVRASDPYWAAIVGWMGRIGTSSRFVVSIHADWDKLHELDPRQGAPKILNSRRLAKVIEAFFLARADGVFCVRPSLARYALASGAHISKIREIPHGIDLAPFRCVEPLHSSQDQRARLVFAGRISRENYIDDVVALARLLKDRSDLIFEILGDGIEYERISHIVRTDATLASMISMPGFVSRDYVIRTRRNATINIVLMGGYSLIEACASGVATIAYDVAWHHELIDNGVSGLLVSEGDLLGLASAVSELLDDPVLRRKIGEEGRRVAFEKHDLKRAHVARIAAYKSILSPNVVERSFEE